MKLSEEVEIALAEGQGDVGRIVREMMTSLRAFDLDFILAKHTRTEKLEEHLDRVEMDIARLRKLLEARRAAE